MKFCFVDQIDQWRPWETIRGVKTVSAEECRLRERLGYPLHLPESLILESLFQLVNWLVILSSDFHNASLGAQFDKARFFTTLKPGARLNMEITVSAQRDDSLLVDGTASDGRQTVVAVERCLAAFVPLESHYDPDDLRTLFSEIHRPR